MKEKWKCVKISEMVDTKLYNIRTVNNNKLIKE